MTPFARGPFTGNLAGVCPSDSKSDEAWMQPVAMEMSHAETAFLQAEGEGHQLRWFTPTSEFDLCGHATLARDHVLF